MANYSEVIHNDFEKGSVRDAEVRCETCIKNAFPTFYFGRLDVIRFLIA